LIFGLCFIQTIGTDHFHVVEPVIVDLTFCLLSKRDSWITSPRNKVLKEGKVRVSTLRCLGKIARN
jgi:hypothetical protein